MEAHEIAGLGKELVEYLSKFSDCFGRSEPREHLREYVRGQASELHRKSIEPIALLNGTPPRTLQRFLESVQWDEERLRDRVQWIVARDHAHPHAIGIVDESGHPKKGSHTAAVRVCHEVECPQPCRADVNGDGSVNVEDLTDVILNWGKCPGCPADVNGDGIVNVQDLTEVILNWGACQ